MCPCPRTIRCSCTTPKSPSSQYCVAAQVWKLNSCDLCELARNSVLQSGFEYPFKAHFLGEKHYLHGTAGNDGSVTNVPNIRIHFRQELHGEELAYITRCVRHGNPNLVLGLSTA